MRAFEGYKKGIDLGGWLSQCGPENYNEGHYGSFITEKDLDVIKGWGMDHVRLPVDYNVIQTEEGDFIESGFSHIDHCIQWCRERELNVVLDLHKTKGYVFDDASYCSFFDDAGLQEQFISLWKELTRRYARYHDRITFELLNEVTDLEFAEKWNDIARRTIKEIRSIDRNVRIMIGGIYNSSIEGLFHLGKPAAENMVYTFHCYSPLIFTHQSAYWIDAMPGDYALTYPAPVSLYKEESKKVFGSDFDADFEGLTEEVIGPEFFRKLFARAVELAEQYDVPLYCGEYGVIDQATPEETLAWYKDIHAAFEEYDISRAAWTYKKMDFGISDSRMDGVRETLLKYL